MPGSNVRAIVGFIPDCVVFFKRLVRDPRVPRRHKLLLAALVPYLLSPVDLIPDFIPVIGQLDDAFLVAFVVRRVARGVGPHVMEELWPGPSASLGALLRLARPAG